MTEAVAEMEEDVCSNFNEEAETEAQTAEARQKQRLKERNVPFSSVACSASTVLLPLILIKM